MSHFEFLVRVARTAFPYWLIGAVLLSLFGAFIAKRKNQESFLPAFIAQMGFAWMGLFVILGVYVQVRGNAMSFAELLPSSSIVALCVSATFLVLAWSKEKIGLGMSILTILLASFMFTAFLALVVSIFPPVVAAHFKVPLNR